MRAVPPPVSIILLTALGCAAPPTAPRETVLHIATTGEGLQWTLAEARGDSLEDLGPALQELQEAGPVHLALDPAPGTGYGTVAVTLDATTAAGVREIRFAR